MVAEDSDIVIAILSSLNPGQVQDDCLVVRTGAYSTWHISLQNVASFTIISPEHFSISWPLLEGSSWMCCNSEKQVQKVSSLASLNMLKKVNYGFDHNLGSWQPEVENTSFQLYVTFI